MMRSPEDFWRVKSGDERLKQTNNGNKWIASISSNSLNRCESEFHHRCKSMNFKAMKSFPKVRN